MLVEGQQREAQRAHLLSTPRRVKVHMSVMAQKNRNTKFERHSWSIGGGLKFWIS